MRTLASLVALAALVASPLAAAGPGACVPRHDGQDLACVSIVSHPGEKICVAESLNPPAPGTWQASSTCVPIVCPPWLCSIKIQGLLVEDLPVVA